MKFKIIYSCVQDGAERSVFCDSPSDLAGALSVLTDERNSDLVNVIDILKL